MRVLDAGAPGPPGRRGPLGAAHALLGLAAALAACSSPAHSSSTPRPDAEVVVLLHGLGRTERSMRLLGTRLSKAGFHVVNLGYPSTELAPDGLVSHLDRELDACCRGATRVHFVTHSLGGIVVRAQLARRRPENLGRVVMLAPPNRGSELVDRVGGSKLFAWALGPTARELGTDAGSLPNRLPAPDYELGVVAGNASLNPIGSALVPGDDDGIVSVARTQLPGVTDFVEVRASHTFIMRSELVAGEVISFLRNGHFLDRGRESPAALAAPAGIP